MIRPSGFRPKLTPDAAAAVLVSLAPLVYFLPAVRGQLVLTPDDGVLFNVPVRVAASRLVLEGHWPLWNPYLFGGMPLHGAAQAGLLFPLNWFFLLFDPPTASNLMMLATYVLAALGAYLYARRSGSVVEGAALTALVWPLSGFMIAQVGHTNVVQTASLLPWLLWAVDGYGATGARGRGVLLAALVALQIFAGHPQTLVYSLAVVALYAACMAHAAGERQARASYLWSLAFVAAGVLLAAIQILPTLEVMRNSVRAGASYEFFTSFSLPPQFLLTFFAPYVVGGGDGRLFRAPYAGPAFYGEYIGYVGVGCLMLAALALVWRRDARTLFWAAVALAGLALALGRFWPFDLYRVIYQVPVINLFRVPARHLLEVDFALAVLAGRAFSALPTARGQAKAGWHALAAGLAVFALTCLAVTAWRPDWFRLSRDAPVTLLRAPELFLPVVAAALSAWALWRFARAPRLRTRAFLVAVVVGDLCLWGQSSGWRTHSPAPGDPFWQTPPTVEFLRGREEAEGRAPYRILTVARPFSPEAGGAEGAGAGEFVLALEPDIYMMHGVENAAGYDGFGVARYSRLADDMKPWGELSDPVRSLRGGGREFDLLNVRYLFTQQTDGQPKRQEAEPPPAAPPSGPPVLQTLGGYKFAGENLNVPPLERGARLRFDVPGGVAADRVALVTNLSFATGVAGGTVVGRVRLRAEDGDEFSFDLLAGQHTSEWAYDRADVRAAVRHERATLATSFKVEDAGGRYEGHTYVAAFALPAKVKIVGGEVEVAAVAEAPGLSLAVERVSLLDEAGGAVVPVNRERVRRVSASEGARGVEGGGGRWRPVAQLGRVAVYENTRALPRAWLAGRAVALPEQAALEVIRTGRLPDGRAWEPWETALVETPVQAGGAAGRAEVTGHGPNRVEVRTASEAPSVLVLSENFYPGWRAYVDGRAVEVLRVDYNLRGVALPAGEHTVEFVYRPRSVIFGLLLSLVVAVALGGRWLLGRRK